MKLLRYGPAGEEKPGLIDQDGNIRSLAAHLPDIDGSTLSDATIAQLQQLDSTALPMVDRSTSFSGTITRPSL